MHKAIRPYSLHNHQIFFPILFYVLYFTLVRYKLLCAAVIWNSITSTDANRREHVQQKFASVCVYHFFPHVLVIVKFLP
jgi:hypothetical protein